MIYTFEVRLSKGAFWERLSRVKTNAVITINQVVKGIGRQLVGAKLCSDHLKKRRRRIVEFIGEIGSAESSKCYRVIGFWNLEGYDSPSLSASAETMSHYLKVYNYLKFHAFKDKQSLINRNISIG
jgi:hypothetical protein